LPGHYLASATAFRHYLPSDGVHICPDEVQWDKTIGISMNMRERSE
jgi:hypothetical protein